VRSQLRALAPTGNPLKLGVCVAMPAFVSLAAQQWICAAVAAPDTPENVIDTVLVDMVGNT
jgi:hypothetical protein